MGRFTNGARGQPDGLQGPGETTSSEATCRPFYSPPPIHFARSSISFSETFPGRM